MAHGVKAPIPARRRRHLASINKMYGVKMRREKFLIRFRIKC